MKLSKEVIQQIQSEENRGNESYLSAYYYEDPIKERELKYELGRLLKAFPEIQPSVMESLIEQIGQEKIGPTRLQTAVDYVIKNFNYQKLRVSDVIKFDRKLRLYTYEDVCNKVVLDGAKMSGFFIVPNSGNLWAVKTDAVRLGLGFLIGEK